MTAGMTAGIGLIQKMYFWTQCTLEEEKATHKDFVLI